MKKAHIFFWSLIFIQLGVLSVSSFSGSDRISNFNNKTIIGEPVRLLGKASFSSIGRTVLHDLNGNQYFLEEGKDSGYAIYDAKSGVVIEKSEKSKNPYRGFSPNSLYYFGPMNYFVRNGDSFYSIYDNQKMSVTYTASLQDILENQLNSARGGINPDYSFNTEFGNGVSPANRYYIPYRWYVSTIEHPDNFDGKCGFVAASLILNWWDRTKKEFIPSEYREDNGNLVRKTHAEDEKYSLADHLVDLNGGVKEPWALTVRDTLVKFGNEVGIKAEAGYFLGGINLGNEIKDGRPTILFGALPDIRTEHHSKIAHAVAVYGTEKHEWLSYFIVNYGWNDEFYNEVVLNSGFFGSTTTFRLVG